MQLSFETAQVVTSGANPTAFNAPGELCQLIYVNGTNRLEAITASVPDGEWGSLSWSEPVPAARDTDVDLLRLRYIPGIGLYGTWLNDGVDHRIGAFEAAANLSAYLVSGSLSFDRTNLVNGLQLELENPEHQLLGEDSASLLYPGARLVLQFRAGNSDAYPIGVRYIDHAEADATGSTLSIEGRNTIGRLLVDQTFDEGNHLPPQLLQHTFEAVLNAAGVPNYVVGPTSFSVGMEFPPAMSYYDGVLELLKTVRDWKIAEDVNGTIRIGFVTGDGSPHDQPGEYTFQRGSEVFSRRIVRDDSQSSARVRVFTADGTVTVYRNVLTPDGWDVPQGKTLHVQVADGTTLANATDYADNLAEQLASMGVVETFTGPFRPHLQPGDQATIVSDNGSTLLGVITTITQKFGKSGFSTEFVVDSGGRVSKPSLSDYIARIGQTATAGSAKRLYS